MEKGEFCVVINNFYLKKWTTPQIKSELQEVYIDFATALKIISVLMNINMAEL